MSSELYPTDQPYFESRGSVLNREFIQLFEVLIDRFYEMDRIMGIPEGYPCKNAEFFIVEYTPLDQRTVEMHEPQTLIMDANTLQSRLSRDRQGAEALNARYSARPVRLVDPSRMPHLDIGKTSYTNVQNYSRDPEKLVAAMLKDIDIVAHDSRHSSGAETMYRLALEQISGDITINNVPVDMAYALDRILGSFVLLGGVKPSNPDADLFMKLSDVGQELVNGRITDL
jgi:hypothetical protein